MAKLSLPGPLGTPEALAQLTWHLSHLAVPSPLGQPALRADKVWPAWLSIPSPLGQPAAKAKVRPPDLARAGGIVARAAKPA